MPVDITMCEGGACPQRAQCYRFRGIPVGRQNWFGSPPWQPGQAGACDHFWDIAGFDATEQQIRDRAYWIWQAAGQPEGQAEAHWQQAEAELRQQLRAHLRDDPDASPEA